MTSQNPPLPSENSAAGNLRLVCSFGGRIVPRGESFYYSGGESRIVVVERTISLESLLHRLASVAGMRRTFAVKYQLPGERLDSLITLAIDEDLENMISEYDRTVFLHRPRLRLFLFPRENSAESTPPENRVANVPKRWDSLSLVNRLLGLDSPSPETSPETSSSASSSPSGSSATPISSLPPTTPPVPLVTSGEENRRRHENSFRVSNGVHEQRINPYDQIQSWEDFPTLNCHNYPVYYAPFWPFQTGVEVMSVATTGYSTPLVQIPANLGMQMQIQIPMFFPEASAVQDRQTRCSYIV